MRSKIRYVCLIKHTATYRTKNQLKMKFMLFRENCQAGWGLQLLFSGSSKAPGFIRERSAQHITCRSRAFRMTPSSPLPPRKEIS